MFGLSFAELFVIFTVALLVLGPEKLPEFARKFGKLTNALKRQTDSLRREWYNAVYIPSQETKNIIEQSKRSLRTIENSLHKESLSLPENPPSSREAGEKAHPQEIAGPPVSLVKADLSKKGE